MVRPFRFEPPSLRGPLIRRPRLLDLLRTRSDRPVTLVVGGAGLGKTTLLSQAWSDGRHERLCHDIWLTAEPSDRHGTVFAQDLLRALERPLPDDLDEAGDVDRLVTLITDAIWSRAPGHVALFIDEAHLLGDSSPAACTLAGVIHDLPSNGHVVLAGRALTLPGLARLLATGEALAVDEGALRFDAHDVASFAQVTGSDGVTVEGTGGWPALCALAALGHGATTERFMWDEVLAPLALEQRQELRMLVDLGEADAHLLEAALGRPVHLGAWLEAVPLIARDDHGWYCPHDVWHTGLDALDVVPLDLETARRRAVIDLVGRDRLDLAFGLVQRHGRWDLVGDVLLSAVRDGKRPDRSTLEAWLVACPPGALDAPAGRLARGVLSLMAQHPDTVTLLREAAEGFRRDGTVSGEVTTIIHLGRLAWWRHDAALLGELLARCEELAAEGDPRADVVARSGQALLLNAAGRRDEAIAVLGSVPDDVLAPAWHAAIGWLRADLEGFDQPDIVERLTAVRAAADPSLQLTIDQGLLAARWFAGEVEAVITDLGALIDKIERNGVVQNIAGANADLAVRCAHVGDTGTARTLIERVRRHQVATPNVAVRLATAEASLALAEGDVPRAQAILRHAADERPIEEGRQRAAWRERLPLSYVLLPEQRPTWDHAALSPRLQEWRTLARWVVAEQEGLPVAAAELRTGPIHDAGFVRAALHHRHAAVLVAALERAGHPAARPLAAALGEPGRTTLAELARSAPPRLRRPASTLLARVPRRPAVAVRLEVLGPLAVLHDGVPVDAAPLRRARVRELLGFLAVRREARREEVVEALWPELDPLAGANNLRVTLTHTLRALEPWREAREPSALVQSDGDQLHLATSWLEVDLERFDHAIAAAEHAEREGRPAVALDHLHEACGLVRGELLEGTPCGVWADGPREHLRIRAVAAGGRALELLLARRSATDLERADEMCARLLALDPWHEVALISWVTTACHRGEPEEARRRLRVAHERLSDLGVSPRSELAQLEDRLR